jgi:hypothetical protein
MIDMYAQEYHTDDKKTTGQNLSKTNVPAR